ncbi:MAG: glutathione S-transferase N-terminal domain-containing protein [Rhizomicrobium sp.]
MKLYSHPASPFGRKCKIIAHELGLKLEVIVVNARDDEELRKINPLKKIPILILDDGSTLFDSRVICEYLNDKGGGKFFPAPRCSALHTQHWKALTLQALAGRHHGCRRGRCVTRRRPRTSATPTISAATPRPSTAGLDALERVKFAPDPAIGEGSRRAARWAISISATPSSAGVPPGPNSPNGSRNFRNTPSMLATSPPSP